MISPEDRKRIEARLRALPPLKLKHVENLIRFHPQARCARSRAMLRHQIKSLTGTEDLEALSAIIKRLPFTKDTP